MNTTWTPETLEDLACYWLSVHGVTHKALSSLKRDQGILRKYLLPAFGQLRLHELSNTQIEEWFARLAQSSGLAAKSCNDVLGLLKKICSDGERWGYVARNPATRIKKLRPREVDYEFWSLEAIQRYLGYWGAREQPRIFAPTVVALYTGLRRGELAGLRWDCVDFASGLITVKRSYCRIAKRILEETKSRKIRHVPICAALASYLRSFKAVTGSSGLVLPFFHPDRYHVEFKRTCAVTGVPRIRFHDLRHTFASHFLIGGGNIYDLQKILGHATIQMTERYLHLVPEQLRGKTEVLGF